MTMTIEPLFTTKRMEYETPRGGISLGGYVARRLHKTILLAPVAEWIQQDSAQALAQIGLYAIAGSTSFGPAMYQPDGNRPGDVVETRDPETNARVRVEYEGDVTFSYRVELDGLGALWGREQILGTTVGLRGLGMPAPSTFEFASADGSYTAALKGMITSELAPGIGRWRVRGYGELQLKDNQGNQGTLKLDRAGNVEIVITTVNGKRIERREKLVA